MESAAEALSIGTQPRIRGHTAPLSAGAGGCVRKGLVADID